MSDLAPRLGHALGERYVIERELGRGLFATVFAARDAKHGRRVAVKVLRPELATDTPTARFDREIAIAASLHHPHIVPLFDSGHAEGMTYFIMPYVEGETLRQLIERERTLPVPEAIRMARQVASALSYAHARGIIHRDVKPENILIAADVPQLSDFGVAQGLLSSGAAQITEDAVFIGTPAYMSPEQWSGGSRVDERSDLYSLGCVLFEMLVGEPPFSGRTPQIIMARQAVNPTPSARAVRDAIPVALDHTLRRALARDPADRHADLSEFAAELAEIETAVAASRTHPPDGVRGGAPQRSRRAARDRPGIVVLPFAMLSPGATDAYIPAGLTDELITSLTGLDELRVISHTAAAQLAGTRKSARELGSDLNVSWVLEGSVQRAGESLRVATRLVSADSEELVWATSYEGLLADLFELEKRICAAVVDAMAIRLSRTERERMARRRVSDARAFEYYIRARQEVYAFTEDALTRALELLRRGAEISGDNVALWAAMGYVYWQHINAGISADPVYFERARACADRIREIDPESPEARRLLGLIEIHARGDPQVAVDHLRAALDANPDDPDALFWLSLIYGCVGRPSSGYALAIRLLDIDPVTPLHYVVPGFLDVLDGDPQRALPRLLRAHELEPGNPITAIAYGQALAMASHREAACAVLEEISDHVPGSFFAELGHVYAAALRGDAEAARAHLTDDVIENARHDLQYSWTLAQCHALLGDHDEARAWVENAVRQGFWNYPLLAERDAMLAPLRGDPRYDALMHDTKARWLNFRA